MPHAVQHLLSCRYCLPDGSHMKHTFVQPKDGTSLCDICQDSEGAPHHTQTESNVQPEKIAETAKYHSFKGTGKFCAECENGPVYEYHIPERRPVNRHAFIGVKEGRSILCTECGHDLYHISHLPQEAPKQETIAEEAQRIVYGDREKTYDDPNRNFRKLALMWQGILDTKIVPGQHVSANDVALMLVCLKLSRESFKPNRENRVDGIGYWLCLERIVEEEEKTDATE